MGSGEGGGSERQQAVEMEIVMIWERDEEVDGEITALSNHLFCSHGWRQLGGRRGCEQEGDTRFRSLTFPHNLGSLDGPWHGQR